MIQFLRNFRLHQLSFWLGFLSASLFWWLISRSKPYFFRLKTKLQERVKSSRDKKSVSAERLHRQNTLRHAQTRHLAASLFSLDEIILEPRLLAPPPFNVPGEAPPYQDIVQKTIPYLPDFPSFSSEYQAPTLTIEEALQGNGNLAIIGPPGSGKTVCLAFLASRIALQEADNPELNELVPFYISAWKLLELIPDEDPIKAVTRVIQSQPHLQIPGRLEEFVQFSFKSGKALFLLDGLDELSPKDIQSIRPFIKQIQEDYPLIRMLVSASDHYYDGLLDLGFAPVAVAGWNQYERVQFAKQWASLWHKYIAPSPEAAHDPRGDIDPLLLNGWLLFDPAIPTPLIFTLKVWAIYAGDVRGPSELEALQSYLLRMTAEITKNPLLALRNIAWQAVNHQRLYFSEKDAQNWIKSDDYVREEDEGQASPFRVLINTLLENGLLESGLSDTIKFKHLAIAGYLAGFGLQQVAIDDKETFLRSPAWDFKYQTLRHTRAGGFLEEWLEIVKQQDDLLSRNLIQTGTWLPTIPEGSRDRQVILKTFTEQISNSQIPYESRFRLAASLALTGDPQVGILFRHLLKSPYSALKSISALCGGIMRDSKIVNELIQSLGHTPEVDRAICLALVNIGSSRALNAVADALLSGSDQLRRAAAEALANHPIEGHPALQDGSTLEDDFLVRHAVVYGLRRIHEPWAVRILEKIQVDEKEWMVRDAAQQAIEKLHSPPEYSPRPLPMLKNTPWLIAFAGQDGTGLASEESAQEVLARALEKGTEEEKLGALSLIQRKGLIHVFPALFHALYGDHAEINRAAYEALWHLGSAGVEIPNPKQFGFG